MDGYALRARELAGASKLQPVVLLEDDVQGAGYDRPKPVRSGHARRIMTGAPLPPGTDSVVPVERIVRKGRVVSFSQPIGRGAYVRRQANAAWPTG